MELDEQELYWTRKQKGLVKEEETERYIRNLEKKINKLEENYIPKSLVRDLLKELNNEYIKQEEIFNKHFEKENRDMQDYYIQKEATNIMQEISWLEGKIEELLEGDK